MKELENAKKQAKNALKKASNLQEVDKIWREYLGRKGLITNQLRALKNLTLSNRKKEGLKLNIFKKELEELFKLRIAQIQHIQYGEQIKNQWIDVSKPSPKKVRGSLHPLTKTLNEIEDIFSTMGFESVQGPQIETEWYNFDALNIPPNHPARDLWDTFWLKSKDLNNKFLLRTHTSPVQIRYMEKNNPPIRIIAPGRVFRYEATDASHEIQFYQVEGLMVDKEISIANFRAVIAEFLKNYFKKDIKFRLRPSFFPFVEPGFEVDISCINCNSKGCSLCSQKGWLEVMGAGMVHPNVLKAVGYNPKNYTGFAFGVGIDRLALLKYKIDDVRLFHSGDIRFLEQF